jgi:lipopolysaccharide transport system permease protein
MTRRDWRLSLEQVAELTRCEWKLREQSSVVGFLWTLLHPLLMFAVLYALFTKWMGDRMSNYAAFLLIGVVQYGFFNNATTYGLSSLSRRSAILMNFDFPRGAVVLASVLSVALSHLLELGLMLGFLCAIGASPTLSWLALPLLTLLQLAVICGLALVVAVVAARFPDFERVWSVLMTAGFFLTPVFYTLDVVDERRRRFLWLNPITRVIELSRDCLLRGRFPAAGDLAWLGLAAAVLLAAGYGIFKRNEKHLADYVAV